MFQQAYSLDLRKRVTRAIAQGKSCRAAAEQCEVSPATAIRFQQRLKRAGSLQPGPIGRPRGGGKLEPFRVDIIGKVEAQPDITMPDLAAWLLEQTGLSVDPSNLSKFLCKAGYTYKKTLMASERGRSDIRQERDAWHRHRLPAMQANPARLIFVDETSVKTNMTPIRGRSPKGVRLVADAPSGRWSTQTFIAGLRCHELVAPFVINGAMDGDIFETYVRTQLAPTLNKGDVVIWDNLNVHKNGAAHKAIRERGAWVLFLPRYSPELNPIEKAFSKLKAWLRKAKARTYDDLWRAIGSVCELFSPQECRNFFKAAGCVS